MKHSNFILSICFLIFFVNCNNSNFEFENSENQTFVLTENNFYEYIKQFEYLTYYENGNIKEYNYVSPKTGDTLLKVYYNIEGIPDSVDKQKRQVYIASKEFSNGNSITFSVAPPKFYNRIRVYKNIDNEESVIDTFSNTVKYNVYDLPKVDILFTLIDSTSNKALYDAHSFVKLDFDSTKLSGSFFFFK